MVKPEDQRNAEIMQARGPQPREAHGAGEGRAPWPNEVVGLHEPPYHPIGVDALSPLLLHVAFPATKSDIAQAIGDARIAVSQDHSRKVREILEILAPERFASSREVEEAVRRAWPQVAGLQGRGARHQKGDNLEGRRRA